MTKTWSLKLNWPVKTITTLDCASIFKPKAPVLCCWISCFVLWTKAGNLVHVYKMRGWVGLLCLQKPVQLSHRGTFSYSDPQNVFFVVVTYNNNDSFLHKYIRYIINGTQVSLCSFKIIAPNGSCFNKRSCLSSSVIDCINFLFLSGLSVAVERVLARASLICILPRGSSPTGVFWLDKVTRASWFEALWPQVGYGAKLQRRVTSATQTSALDIPSCTSNKGLTFLGFLSFASFPTLPGCVYTSTVGEAHVYTRFISGRVCKKSVRAPQDQTEASSLLRAVNSKDVWFSVQFSAYRGYCLLVCRRNCQWLYKHTGVSVFHWLLMSSCLPSIQPKTLHKIQLYVHLKRSKS